MGANSSRAEGDIWDRMSGFGDGSVDIIGVERSEDTMGSVDIVVVLSIEAVANCWLVLVVLRLLLERECLGLQCCHEQDFSTQ